jgi:hypothetical protein
MFKNEEVEHGTSIIKRTELANTEPYGIFIGANYLIIVGW